MNLPIKIIILACLSTLCFSQNFAPNVSPKGKTVISKNLGKITAKVIFYTSETNIDLDKRPKKYTQCTYSRKPCVLIDFVEISISEKEVFVPNSAFMDLGDIARADWSTSKEGIILTITGGDASESYIAVYKIQNMRIVERRLFAGEDTSQPLQITKYFIVRT